LGVSKAVQSCRARRKFEYLNEKTRFFSLPNKPQA